MAKFFSEQEIRGLLVFLPLAAIGIAALMLAKPKNDPEEAMRVEQGIDTCTFRRTPYRPAADPSERILHLRKFDPNTVSYEELLAMGLTEKEALGLYKYRLRGKIFQIPEDVDECYAIDHAFYLRLKPYIDIAPRFRLAPKQYRRERIVRKTIDPIPFRVDTVNARYLQAIGALSQKQAKVFIRYREAYPIRSMEDVRQCYVISDSVADALEPYLLFPEAAADSANGRINLNRADSAELCRVIGIGEKTVGKILAYRERLGGFVRAEQLAEIPGITERNYERIVQQIYCNSCEIQKIDINFADPKKFARHPYIRKEALRKLLHKRQLEGGWSTAEELIEDRIFTREEAEKLAPYLVFNCKSGTIDE